MACQHFYQQKCISQNSPITNHRTVARISSAFSDCQGGEKGCTAVGGEVALAEKHGGSLFVNDHSPGFENGYLLGYGLERLQLPSR